MRNSQDSKNSIQINDLISDAIANATERRNQVVSDLTEEELAKIEGGLTFVNPIIMGRWLNTVVLDTSLNPVSLSR